MSAPRGTTRTAKTMSKTDRLRREKAIIRDIKAGTLSYRQIALKHSVSLPTVNNKARKAGISRGRRKGAKILVQGPRPGRAPKSGKATRRTAKTATRVVRTAVRSPRARASSFQDAFRELVLAHYPNISLRQFEKLSQLVEITVA